MTPAIERHRGAHCNDELEGSSVDFSFATRWGAGVGPDRSDRPDAIVRASAVRDRTDRSREIDVFPLYFAAAGRHVDCFLKIASGPSHRRPPVHFLPRRASSAVLFILGRVTFEVVPPSKSCRHHDRAIDTIERLKRLRRHDDSAGVVA